MGAEIEVRRDGCAPLRRRAWTEIWRIALGVRLARELLIKYPIALLIDLAPSRSRRIAAKRIDRAAREHVVEVRAVAGVAKEARRERPERRARGRRRSGAIVNRPVTKLGERHARVTARARHVIA